MSKNSGYGEMIALVEYIDKIRNEKPKKRLFGKKEKVKDPITALNEMKQAAKAFDDFIKEQEKLNKKEDKDKEKKGWDKLSPLQQAVYITFGMQIMSLMYFSFLFKLLK